MPQSDLVVQHSRFTSLRRSSCVAALLAVVAVSCASDDGRSTGVERSAPLAVDAVERIVEPLETAPTAPQPVVLVERTTTEISLESEQDAPLGGRSFTLDFHRNAAYPCGLTGDHTFLVVDPANAAGARAPLWVYLHGGGFGYTDEDGSYRATFGQGVDDFNHEESLDDLWLTQVVARVEAGSGLNDSTLGRRLAEGYRVLVVSMCDHDAYLGTGGDVNGLQATMAAIDHTTATYPTSDVYLHGASAGSIGVWAVAHARAGEGLPVAGAVADSFVLGPRFLAALDELAGSPGSPYPAEMAAESVVAALGRYADPVTGLHAAAAIGDGWSGPPVLFIGGDADPFCGAGLPELSGAAGAELSNCDWMYDGVRQAVADQADTPHAVSILDGAPHVPTLAPGPANDLVDDFLAIGG